MREKLKSLYLKYSQKFEDVVNRFPNDNLHGPFVISPNVNYSNSKRKLMVVGQETYGWVEAPATIEQSLKQYEEFNVGETYYSSPFWNVTRKLESALGNEHLSCAWTNLSRFDVGGERPYGEHAEVINMLDEILPFEITIVDPDVCVFYTGPNFDYRIHSAFKGVSYKKIPGWTERQFAQLSHPSLPKYSFRVYHPNYLRRSGLESEILEKIVELIN